MRKKLDGQTNLISQKNINKGFKKKSCTRDDIDIDVDGEIIFGYIDQKKFGLKIYSDDYYGHEKITLHVLV